MTYVRPPSQQLVADVADVQRFWGKVGPATTSGCFPWLGGLNLGYGKFSLRGKSVWAHRFAYMMTHGSVPVGWHVDHLCRNPVCVNVDHLEAVPARINVLRGEGPTARYAQSVACPRGHEYDYVAPDGRRGCRSCRKKSADLHRTKRNEKRREAWIGRGR